MVGSPFSPAAVTVPSLKSCLGCCKRCYSLRKQEATGSTQLVGMTGYPTRTYDQWWTRLVLLVMGTKSKVPLLWHRLYVAAVYVPHIPKIKTFPSMDNTPACPSVLWPAQPAHLWENTTLAKAPQTRGKEKNRDVCKLWFYSLSHLPPIFLTLFYIIHTMWMHQCYFLCCPLSIIQTLKLLQI